MQAHGHSLLMGGDCVLGPTTSSPFAAFRGNDRKRRSFEACVPANREQHPKRQNMITGSKRHKANVSGT